MSPGSWSYQEDHAPDLTLGNSGLIWAEKLVSGRTQQPGDVCRLLTVKGKSLKPDAEKLHQTPEEVAATRERGLGSNTLPHTETLDSLYLFESHQLI